MKKLLAVLLVLAMVFSLAACGGGKEAAKDGGTFDITVWVPELAVDLTKQQIADFNSSNEYGITFNATVEPVSEAVAANNMITDVEAGGDIFFFAQDQFARLVQAGALNKLGAEAAATVTAANDPGVVKAATSGTELFAYPLTSDNGYFMYYDKSVIPEEDVDSLEKLIADCEAAGKYFAFEVNTSAWYIASWFFATGCVSEWITDEDGKFISIKDTFDSPEGLIAVKGMKKLVSSPMHLSSGSASEFSSGAAIVVSGIWDYETAKGILGDNLGATDLPSFEVDGKEYHLGSFNGCKLLGVKPQADAAKGAALHLLAQYLTGEKAQMERFDALSWGPSNLADQQSEAVQANPGLAALLAQAPYSVPQGNIEGSWWDIAKVIGDDVKDATDEAGLQAALDNYSAKIDAVFQRTEEDLAAWSVIGSICGTSWDTDFPMTEGGGCFVSEPLELHTGDEFKVRQGASWTVNFGADGTLDGPNFVVEAPGIYEVVLEIKSETEAVLSLNKVGDAEDPEGTEPVDTRTEEEKNAWSLIGAFAGTNWDTDVPLTETDAVASLFPVLASDPIEFAEGDEFKIRQGADWAVNYGATGKDGDNIKIEEAGTYTVVFEPATGKIDLLKDGEDALINIFEGVAEWGVVGTINGWGETDDLPMTAEDVGLFKSEAIELKAGDEIKVRLNADWAVNYGADGPDGANVKVEEAGTYIVVFDLVAGTVTLEKA